MPPAYEAVTRQSVTAVTEAADNLRIEAVVWDWRDAG